MLVAGEKNQSLDYVMSRIAEQLNLATNFTVLMSMSKK